MPFLIHPGGPSPRELPVLRRGDYDLEHCRRRMVKVAERIRNVGDPPPGLPLLQREHVFRCRLCGRDATIVQLLCDMPTQEKPYPC